VCRGSILRHDEIVWRTWRDAILALLIYNIVVDGGIVAAVTATVAVEVVVDMATVVAVVKTADNHNNFELLVSCCTYGRQRDEYV
jgi:hypothetical protein